MAADKQLLEGKAKAREEVRAFSPMAGRAVKPQDTKTQSPVPNIRYTILREESEGTYSTVDAETTFQAGNRVRLALEPLDNGYLYVLTRDPTGNVKILFPPDETGETARVEKMVRYLVPATGAFTFEKPIDHRVTIVFSQTRLTDVRVYCMRNAGPEADRNRYCGESCEERPGSQQNAGPPPERAPAASLTRVEITLKRQ